MPNMKSMWMMLLVMMGVMAVYMIDGNDHIIGGALNVELSALGAAVIAPGSYTLMTWGGASAPSAIVPSVTVPDGTTFAINGNSLVMTMADAKSQDELRAEFERTGNSPAFSFREIAQRVRGYRMELRNLLEGMET